ncbi:MAG: hypothetical protein IKI69_01930 [Oscillospiraceae bacterium]|nr:hypothetical protein [Oscillospiraceae bacterium]
MKAWKVLMPVSLAAGLAAWLLMKKMPQPKAEQTQTPAESSQKPLPEGVYDFISGYENAHRVLVSIPYDPGRFTFSILSEEYPATSAASHVALLDGEEYRLQLEYASFYQGEDFAALARSSEAKYQGFRRWQHGENAGFSYLDGDDWRFAIEIPGDGDSYLLLTALRADAEAEDFVLLPDDAALQRLLAGLQFSLQD